MKTFIEFLDNSLIEGLSSSTTQYYYILYKNTKVPLFKEEGLTSSLLETLKTYISVADKADGFQSLQNGVRFILIYSEKKITLYVWPQHVLHTDLIKIATNKNLDKTQFLTISEVYNKLMDKNPEVSFFLFSGTLLARDNTIQSNLSRTTFLAEANKFFKSTEELIKTLKLTDVSIKFSK